MHTVFRSDKRLTELEKVKQGLEIQLQEMARTVEKQQELIALAKRDPLTGLRNRQGIPELVNARLRERHEGIFFIMDMDNFKRVNDTYGHIEGDRMLTRFARGLKRAVDAQDIVARLGGDEFVVFSPGHFDKYEVKAKAQRLIRQVERDLAAPGKLIQVTVSMGIASAPRDGVTYEALYGKADQALYSVKNDGKNGYRFFDDLDEEGSNAAAYDRPQCSLVEITHRLRERKMDLEDSYTEGSYEVEYSNFEKIYRFIERNLIRDHREVQCVLFTLDEPVEVDAVMIQRQAEHLHHVIVSSLRRGDVTAKYSATQVLALLMDTNKKNADRVVKRILTRYCAEADGEAMHVLYDIQQLMSGEECGCV